MGGALSSLSPVPPRLRDPEQPKQVLALPLGQAFPQIDQKPNHVTTHPDADSYHHIDPIEIASSLASLETTLLELHGRLKDNDLANGVVIQRTDDQERVYLWMEFKTPVGFIDDVEVLLTAISEERTNVEIRSCSRVGYSDMNANRKRVEALFQKLLRLQ